MCAMSNKPEVPQKPRHLPPPPVPLRTNKPQQQSQQQTAAGVPPPSLPHPGTTSTGGLDSDYPMNPTWFFHSPPPSCGSLKSSSDWIKERTKAAVDLPPKLCLKSVPVLPVRPSNQKPSPAVKSPPVIAVKSVESSSSSSSESSSSSSGPKSLPRRDLNFTNEIKSRCSQRLTERLPPQVHYNSNVSI